MFSKRYGKSLGFLGVTSVAVLGIAGSLWAGGPEVVNVNIVDHAGRPMRSASVAYQVDGGLAKATPRGEAGWLIKHPGDKLIMEVGSPRRESVRVETLLPPVSEVSVTVRFLGKRVLVEVNPPLRGASATTLGTERPQIRPPARPASAQAPANVTRDEKIPAASQRGGFAECGAAGTGDCCTATPGIPGCMNDTCCQAVCSCDPYCCGQEAGAGEWDAFCAGDGFVAGCGAAILCTDICAGGGGPPACDNGIGDCCAAHGNAGCDDPTCCATVCAADAFCCDVEWDGICANLAAQLCPACAGPPCDVTCDPGKTPENEPNCGIPEDTINGGCNSAPVGGASNCCAAHAGPGCDDAACQATVCAADAFCCDVEWDGLCAGAAASLCGSLCTGLDYPFSPLVCGQSYCGTAAFDGGSRDTDWYRITIASDTEMTWTVSAEFDALIGLVATAPPGTGNCADSTGSLTPFALIAPCDTGVVTACLSAGTYWWFVAPQFTDLVNCGAEYNATLTCVAAGTGACCLASGTCLPDQTCAQCDAAGGSYQGAGSSCTPNPCPQPPNNDDCDSAITLVAPANVTGSTALATFDVAPTCNGFNVSAPGVWYTVQGTGNEMTVSLCNAGTNYDTKLHVYCPECNDLNCVLGDDDFCGFPPGYSQGTWCSELNRPYKILVSGFGASVGDFELTLTEGPGCSTPPTCMGVCGNQGGDCCDATPGIAGCMDATCCQAVCAADAFCCDVEWDQICADTAEQLCPLCFPPPCFVDCAPGTTPENEPDCGIPSDTVNGGCNGVPVGGSNCCFAHAGPGCDDATCQGIVCAADAFCCDVEWDGLCAGAAASMCGTLCSSTSYPFSPIACGQTYCSTAAFDGGLRDTDWYQIVIAADTEFTWCLVGDGISGDGAEFDWLIGMVETSPLGAPDCATATALDPFLTGDSCTTGCVTRCVPPGTYWWFVAPQFTSPVPCGAEYEVRLTCVQCDAPEAPANDLCEDAIPLALPADVSGSTDLAGLDAFPACDFGPPSAPGVWYSVAGTGGTITASLCNPGTNYDSKLYVYCPDCTVPMCVVGDDDFCGFPPGYSQVSFCSQVGATYQILVHGFGASTGNFQLTVSSSGGPGSCTPSVACLPPAPTGGCCVAGVCSIQTQAGCAASGGLYLGDGTTCDLPGGSVYADNPNLAIPDNNPAGASDSMTVTDSITISDLNVDLVINHTWVGDLTVSLTHGVTTVVIVDRPGVPASTFGCANDNYNIVLDDEGSGGPIEALCAVSMVSPPNYVPQNPLSAFDGQNIMGLWTINVSDGAAADTGTLLQWSLHLPGSGSVCQPAGACCIHPNCTIDTEAGCLAAGGFYLGDDTVCTIAGPGNSYVANPNAAIPDNSPAGVANTINVPQVFNVSDLDVDLTITHTWVGDLVVSLTHNATTVLIVDRPGVPASTFGCANDNYNIILDDEGSGGAIEVLCAVSMVSPPNYIPQNPLSAFDGMAATGPWILNVSDGAAADTGTLNTWSLHFTSPGTPACIFPGACCNRVTGVCNNNVLPDDCEGDFFKNETCDEITPPCQLPEACCLPGGACQFITPSACLALGGAPRGPGTVCGDPDGDGVHTICGDNCPTVSNPGQQDSDNPDDGVGDACDCGDGILVPGEQCDQGAANGTPASCCTATCTFKASGTQCRASSGAPCDVAESCTGSSAICPPDGPAASGTPCGKSPSGPDGGPCDVADFCDGVSMQCPNGVAAAGTPCGKDPAGLDGGLCDVADSCDGVSKGCVNRVAAAGTPCGKPVEGACDVADSCDGVSKACVNGVAAAGTSCRTSTGVCDPAESCDGLNKACPPDGTITSCTAVTALDGCCPSQEDCCDIDPDCDPCGIPTVSEWGLIVLALLLLAGSKVYFGRREVLA